MGTRLRRAIGVLGSVVIRAQADAAIATYDFALYPAASTVNVALDVSAKTSGEMIGDYDVKDNPAGTRTKPGLFGSFGSDENVPIPVALDPHATGDVVAAMVGSFRLAIDFDAWTVTLTQLAGQFVHDGPIEIATEAGISFSSFRTRSPSSSYIGASLNLPLGQAEVTSLSATQTPEAAVGALTALPDGRYAFAVSPLVVISADVEFAGTAMQAPTSPVPLPLSGIVRIDGQAAELSAAVDLAIDDTRPADTVIPPFDYGLPTILPPGETANLVFSLSMEEISMKLSGPVSMVAAGSPIPEPAHALVLMCLLPALAARQRRG